MLATTTKAQLDDTELQELVDAFQKIADFQCSVMESNVGFGLLGHLNGVEYKSSQDEGARILDAIANNLKCNVTDLHDPVRFLTKLAGKVSADSLDKLSVTSERYYRSEGLNSLFGDVLPHGTIAIANKIYAQRAAAASLRLKR